MAERLIDAEALKKTIAAQPWIESKTSAILAVDWVLMLIDEAPAIDAIRVVRCGECVFSMYSSCKCKIKAILEEAGEKSPYCSVGTKEGD